MKKRLVGSALVASSLLVIFHPLLMDTSKTQPSEFQTESVMKAIPSGQDIV